MKEGDNIYFFRQRNVYGIGKLVNLKIDCKFFNFPNAAVPNLFSYDDVEDLLLWDEGEHSVNQRCICVFEPDPLFFVAGIDMDDVLASDEGRFRMLRVLQGVSFLKFDDDENQAFRDIILKRNQDALSGNGDHWLPFDSRHDQMRGLLNSDYGFEYGMKQILQSCSEGIMLRHEMALETGLLNQLSSGHPSTVEIFGRWDYLTHQVPASPFKPICYMDRIDLFGYAYLPGFRPTRAHFLVAELKRDWATPDDVDQLMKYVDWVKDEYCSGDYSMIHAFLVAHEFAEQVYERSREIGTRIYISGMRPAKSAQWQNLKLVKYSFDATSGMLNFERCT